MTDRNTRLTDDQLRSFKTFGYTILRGFLEPNDLENIEREHREGLAAAFPD